MEYYQIVKKFAGSDKLIFNKFLVLKEDIKLIGEYTMDVGPVNDDWFIEVITNKNKSFYLPVDSKLFNSLITDLEILLEEKITIGLTNRTDNMSRILYPKKYEGETYIDFSYVQATGFWKQLFRVKNIVREMRFPMEES